MRRRRRRVCSEQCRSPLPSQRRRKRLKAMGAQAARLAPRMHHRRAHPLTPLALVYVTPSQDRRCVSSTEASIAVAVHSEALRPRGIPREMLARHRPARATAFGTEESITEHGHLWLCVAETGERSRAALDRQQPAGGGLSGNRHFRTVLMDVNRAKRASPIRSCILAPNAMDRSGTSAGGGPGQNETAAPARPL